MKRREFLAASAAAGLAAPALAQGNASVLRFAPEGNLQNPDPVWTTTTIARDHALMVWDMLYARNDAYLPEPQMVGGHELSDDRLRWTFTLRDGLLFHDGDKVRAIDAVTSINRWGKRRPLGQKLLELTEEMKPLDDNRFEIRLKKPFSLLPLALSDNCFVMPERIARTDPYQQIQEYVGSGPFRFLRDEWITGVQANYVKFDRYVPRKEPPRFAAGGKVVHFDRVEWKIMPDNATAVSALMNDELDWVQQPQSDLLPLLRRNRNVRAVVNDKVGAIAMLALNHLHPPFDNPKASRALLAAIDQSDFMAAVAGSEAELFHVPCGVFTPGQPMANDAGMEVLTGKRDIDAAKRMLAESGYGNEPVVLMSPQDYPALQALAQVAADTMKRVGFNVQYASMDWGTLVQRRTSKEPVDKGGWSAFTTTYAGLTVADPGGHVPLRGNGLDGWFGWPTSPRLEALRDAWFDAPDLAAQKKIAVEMQVIAFEEVPFIPLGQIFYPTAYRTSLKDIVPASFPVFWGVRRA